MNTNKVPILSLNNKNMLRLYQIIRSVDKSFEDFRINDKHLGKTGKRLRCATNLI